MPNSYSHETLFFKNTTSACIATLKRALQATCSLVPIFNGKLAIDQPGRPPVIFHGQYSVSKMLTVHNFADSVAYQDLKSACLHPAAARTPAIAGAVRLLSVVPPYSLQSGGEAPMLRVAVAILHGGLAMTVNFHHLVFDLTSMAVFLRILASYCRGEAPAPFPAECVSRDILRDVPAADYEHHLAALNALIKPVSKPATQEHNTVAAVEQVRPAPPALSSAMIHFSSHALTQLKADITSHLDPHSSPAWITTNDALTALAWTCITLSTPKYATSTPTPTPTPSITREEERSAICMAINLRRRLSPPLPDDYLGAAVCAPPFSASLEMLRAAGREYKALAALSRSIRAKVNSVDAGYVRRCFDTTSPPPADEEQDATAFLPTSPIDFAINSWAEQGACLHNWGPDLGTVECALRLYARSPSVYVMPRLPDNGGLLVHTTLEVEVMERLRGCELWERYATPEW